MNGIFLHRFYQLLKKLSQDMLYMPLWHVDYLQVGVKNYLFPAEVRKFLQVRGKGIAKSLQGYNPTRF